MAFFDRHPMLRVYTSPKESSGNSDWVYCEDDEEAILEKVIRQVEVSIFFLKKT